MEILRKTYLFLMATALLVLLVLRPPLTPLGWFGIGITAISLVAMGAWTTGVTRAAGRIWLVWLPIQLFVDVVAFARETDALWRGLGAGWGLGLAAGSGLVFLPLYLALYRLGRGRFPPAARAGG